jgi:hypothetical protein
MYTLLPGKQNWKKVSSEILQNYILVSERINIIATV